MVTIKITGTLFVALMLGAALFYFTGGTLKQVGEITGLGTLEDVGEVGVIVGLGIVGLFVFGLVLSIVDFSRDR